MWQVKKRESEREPGSNREIRRDLGGGARLDKGRERSKQYG